MADLGSTVAPAGFFVAAPGALAPPSPLLADNIDPKTKDFRDLFEGADVIDDQVQVAVTTRRNSGPSVQEVGVRISASKIDESTKRLLEGDYRLALRRLTRNRDIQFAGVSFGTTEAQNLQPEAQQGQINIQYKNLRALDPRIRKQPAVLTPQITVV